MVKNALTLHVTYMKIPGNIIQLLLIYIQIQLKVKKAENICINQDNNTLKFICITKHVPVCSPMHCYSNSSVIW